MGDVGGEHRQRFFRRLSPRAAERPGHRPRYAVSDGSRAIQSMVLAAWAEGIGSNWVGFAGMPEVNALLGIPDHLDVLAVVPFGYPVHPGGQGQKRRKPLAAVAHRERFGQIFE
jgi:nitroreductase